MSIVLTKTAEPKYLAGSAAAVLLQKVFSQRARADGLIGTFRKARDGIKALAVGEHCPGSRMPPFGPSYCGHGCTLVLWRVNGFGGPCFYSNWNPLKD